jgi:hypothetical protein
MPYRKRQSATIAPFELIEEIDGSRIARRALAHHVTERGSC